MHILKVLHVSDPPLFLKLREVFLLEGRELTRRQLKLHKFLPGLLVGQDGGLRIIYTGFVDVVRFNRLHLLYAGLPLLRVFLEFFQLIFPLEDSTE